MEDRRFTGIGLEVIGKCNASCEFCSWGYDKNMVYENMVTKEKITKNTDKIEIKLIDDILEMHRIKLIIFTGLSEPFMAFDRIKYIADQATERGLKFSSYTNGAVITEDMIRYLLDNPNFLGLHFSLNAATDDTRRKVMKLPIEKSEHNFMKYLELRKQANRENDTLAACVMMLTPNNKHEEGTFRNKWNTIFKPYKNCDAGVFYAGNWGNEVKNYWMQTYGHVRKCAQWDCEAPTVSADGYLYLCCYSSRFIFGHVLDQNAINNWFDRKKIFNISESTKEYPYPCCACNGIYDVIWRKEFNG